MTEDPLEQLIRSEPSSTLEEAGERAVVYIAGLDEIARVNADHPLRAAEEALVLTTRLIASLSPAGSAGPAHLFGPLMEIILALGTGASPSKTTLFKAARYRRGGRPPDPRGRVLGEARAAAVMTMLMRGGLPEKDAARLVANRLKRAGVKFDRSNANPINNVKEWRSKAEGHGHKPMILAYRDALDRLLARITPENSGSVQQVLLEAVDELAELFG